jgi:uncharacterized SAM-binding protein YcdF (DUF218 family)
MRTRVDAAPRARFRESRAAIAVVLSLLSAGCASSAPSLSQAAARDAIVVLGHRPALDERGLEPETLARVTKGVALFRDQAAPLLVLTGGKTGAYESEAAVMGAFAERQGVPRSALRLEGASQSTIENARFTVAMLSAELGRTPRLLLVTSDYHVKRAEALFRCTGADVRSQGVALDALSRWQRFKRRSREVVARTAQWFFDECARVRGE